MPIVNGTYVYDQLPQSKNNTFTTQAFGPDNNLGGRDWNDTTAAAYNYLLKQQEQAYNLELWNLQNQYNSPQSQMKRYQDAGLNPYLVYQQSNMASSPQAASAATFRSAGTHAKGVQNALNMIGQVMNTVRAASETYDYFKYGKQSSAWNVNLIRERSQAQALENYFSQYLLGLGNNDPSVSPIPNSPRATMYRYQVDTQEQKYEQLKALANMIPDQQSRTQALKKLDDERLNIMKNQYGFINNFDTGHPEFDSFFKMLAFFVMGNGL